MSMQGDFFIGVPLQYAGMVDEARAIYKQLGIPVGDGLLGGSGKNFGVHLRGRTYPVYVYAIDDKESEQMAVAFQLTGRYAGRVLDADYESGRTNPFVFNPEDLVAILADVRQWWPEAQVFLWDRNH